MTSEKTYVQRMEFHYTKWYPLELRFTASPCGLKVKRGISTGKLGRLLCLSRFIRGEMKGNKSHNQSSFDNTADDLKTNKALVIIDFST